MVRTPVIRILCCLPLLVAASLPVMGATPCAGLKDFRMEGYSVLVDKAEEIPAGPIAQRPGTPPGASSAALPAHCLVEGSIDKRTGVNGKPYAIGFAVALPTQWNGRFFFQGGGGLNGSVNPPIGAQFSGDGPALAAGYAIVSTDTGHKGSGFDATFFEDRQAALDFLYVANGKVTVVGKAIVERHYGKAPEYSYFVGCSTGGREAMMMSQRYPGYFDGIVSGAPAMRTNYSNVGLRIASEALNAIAPKDEQGRPQTRLALSDSDRKLVVDGFLESCDALDGTRDGVVFATEACRFDPQVLACRGAKTDACLTAAQVQAVRSVMGAKQTTDGGAIYPGYYYDTGITTVRGLAGVLVGTPIPEAGVASGSLQVNELAAGANNARAWVGDTNGWTNLSSFTGHGGKLIFFHGVSDPWFSAQDTVDYYQRMAADNGPRPVEEWSRLFLVPGMGHCSGGERTLDRFNMVEAIASWVEKGQAPERIIATGASMPGESRPLCPFPAHAQYNGSGDAKSAANYSCRK